VNKSGGGAPAWALATPRPDGAKVHGEIRRRSRTEKGEEVYGPVARRFNIMTTPAPLVERQRRV